MAITEGEGGEEKGGEIKWKRERRKEGGAKETVEKGWGGQEENKVSQWSMSVLGEKEERGKK